MNKITLQDLTPSVYYNHSRDFQFIGRLYDIVLNSVKTNTELLYNLPHSKNSDEQLIDLMALTLGFKSKHNYNVKQLTALCSAFTTVIKNKGNINSIMLAVRALLNAEGIEEDAEYNFESFVDTDNYTVLNLFVPQKLQDINLLKDLLNYILPAGMSCNIIKEFRLKSSATSELTTEDSLTIYEGIRTAAGAQTHIPVDSAAKSIIVQAEEQGIADALAKSTPGILANEDIYQPILQGGSIQPLLYNITYITNGGKIENNWQDPVTDLSYKTSFSYSADLTIGLPIKLPINVYKKNTFEKEKKVDPITQKEIEVIVQYKWTFKGWSLSEKTFTNISEITKQLLTNNNITGNLVLFAHYNKNKITETE